MQPQQQSQRSHEASPGTCASASSMPMPPLMPPLPPGPGPPHSNQIPPVAQLLYREGDAWTSLLSLHASVVSTMQHVVGAISMESLADADSDRELQYCAALSQAAAQCDSLHSEIMKLRTLRKTRSAFDMSSIQMLLGTHTRETLAVGSSIASQASISLQTIASEVRNAISELKRTEAELNALNEVLSGVPSYSVPSDFQIHVSTPSSSSIDTRIPLPHFVNILRKHTLSSSGELDMNSFLKDGAFCSNDLPSPDNNTDLESAALSSNALRPVRRTGDKQKTDR